MIKLVKGQVCHPFNRSLMIINFNNNNSKMNHLSHNLNQHLKKKIFNKNNNLARKINNIFLIKILMKKILNYNKLTIKMILVNNKLNRIKEKMMIFKTLKINYLKASFKMAKF